MMFIGTILLVASLLSLSSFASATSISGDALASLSSSNDENDDINSLLIEYNQIINHYDSDNLLLLNSNDRIIEEDEGCDESFPLAPTTTTLASLSSLSDHGKTRRQLKVAIPPSQNNIQTSKWYETGEYYAPTCHDVKTNKRRIDIRYLQQCFGGACWDPQIGVSFHSKI